MSIGLPQIILDNPKVVLVLYLLMIVVIIPIAVLVYLFEAVWRKNVKYDTYTAFYQLLTENHRVKNMPEVLTASAESRRSMHLSIHKSQLLMRKLAYDKIFQKAKNEKLIVKPTARCTGFEVVRVTFCFICIATVKR